MAWEEGSQTKYFTFSLRILDKNNLVWNSLWDFSLAAFVSLNISLSTLQDFSFSILGQSSESDPGFVA